MKLLFILSLTLLLFACSSRDGVHGHSHADGSSHGHSHSNIEQEPKKEKTHYYAENWDTVSIIREDFAETEVATPIKQKHLTNQTLKLELQGAAKRYLKKSHHPEVANDPHYVWSGLCKRNWALSFKLNQGFCLQGLKIRTKQSGRDLYVLAKNDDGWMIADTGISQDKDWQVHEVDCVKLVWKHFDMNRLRVGEIVQGKADLVHVHGLGFTDLEAGQESEQCTRIDWFECFGYLTFH